MNYKEKVNAILEQLDIILTVGKDNRFYLNTSNYGYMTMDIDCETFEEVFNFFNNNDPTYLTQAIDKMRDYNHFNNDISISGYMKKAI